MLAVQFGLDERGDLDPVDDQAGDVTVEVGPGEQYAVHPGPAQVGLPENRVGQVGVREELRRVHHARILRSAQRI